jgi:hypothetical protein
VGRFFFQSPGGLSKTRESDRVFGNRGIVKKNCLTHPLTPEPFLLEKMIHCEVCKFMHPPVAACQRIGPVVLQALCNHGENLLRILCQVFIRKIHGLLLSTRLEDELLCSCRCT